MTTLYGKRLKGRKVAEDALGSTAGGEFVAGPRSLSDLGCAYCAGGKSSAFFPAFSLHRTTMRHKIMKNCPRSPSRLATGAQVRQAPRQPPADRARELERTMSLILSPIEQEPIPNGGIRIWRRTPPIAQAFGWTLDAVAMILALASLLIGPPGGSPLLLSLAASALIGFVGEFTRTGVTELRIEPGSQRVIARTRTRFGTLPMTEYQAALDPDARVSVDTQSINRHRWYMVRYRAPGQKRPIVAFSHPEKQGAQLVREQIEKALANLTRDSAASD